MAETYDPADWEAEIEARFTYHPPTEDQPPRYEQIRAEAKAYALTLVSLCPPSRELSSALTHLDQVVMFANAAIARREPGGERWHP